MAKRGYVICTHTYSTAKFDTVVRDSTNTSPGRSTVTIGRELKVLARECSMALGWNRANTLRLSSLLFLLSISRLNFLNCKFVEGKYRNTTVDKKGLATEKTYVEENHHPPDVSVYSLVAT